MVEVEKRNERMANTQLIQVVIIVVVLYQHFIDIINVKELSTINTFSDNLRIGFLQASVE